LILYGPSGTGKTVAGLLFAREFLGDAYASNFKYLNIRDIRSITIAAAKRTVQQLAKLDRSERDELDEYMSIVFREAKSELKTKGHKRDPNRSQLLQTAIRLFASTITVTDEGVKILLLDEADALDNNMQQALRRTMEIYNEACRFILVTDSMSGWSPAVVSRSIILRFPALDNSSIEELVSDVASKEGITIDEPALRAISKESVGNARYALGLLQIAAADSKAITEDVVYHSSKSDFKEGIKEILSLSLKGSYVKARENLRKMLTRGGYSPSEVITEIQRDILLRPFSPEIQELLLDRISEIDHRLTQARNPFIQLSALLASIWNIASQAES
jgi:replication factor C small subunit